MDSTILERRPPFDLDAEVGVIGSMLLAPNVTDDVSLLIDPSDFYDDANQRLYGAILAVHNKGGKIDPTLLSDHLKRSGDYEHVGGGAYIAKCLKAVPNAAHAVYYARVVREKSTLRKVITASTESLRDAYDDIATADELLDHAESRILSIRDSRKTTSLADIRGIVESAVKEITARKEGTATAAIATGYQDLDGRLSGGFRESNLVILAARPAVGKSALAANIVERICGNGGPVLFVSLEMSKDELCERMLAGIGRVSTTKMRSGTVSLDDLQRIESASAELSKFPLWIEDAATMRVSDIASHARRLARKLKKALSLLVVDYIQLLEPDNPRAPRQEQVAAMARRLKILAKDQKCPVLALCQLNRKSEESTDRRPKLHQLRESGALEQDADIVLLLSRNEGAATLEVAKQRNGPTGDVDLVWLGQFSQFETLEKRVEDRKNYEPAFAAYNDRDGQGEF